MLGLACRAHPIPMALTDRHFVFAHLRAASGGWQALQPRLGAIFAAWPQTRLQGLFNGLFGLSNHDLFALFSVPAGTAGDADLLARLPNDVQAVSVMPLAATVRPVDDAPFAQPGVYVFRFFEVREPDMAEVAELSAIAWSSFERGEDYKAEPQGLFRSLASRDGWGTMLLVTWYDRMDSWERSRTPHPDATANFRRRAALARSIVPYATRLAISP